MNLAVPRCLNLPIDFLDISKQVEAEVNANRHLGARVLSSLVLEHGLDSDDFVVAM